jgi:uncharacterized protein YbgA (DUF1722 family)/uncharacterized protein YbbK (DUF523 family)
VSATGERPRVRLGVSSCLLGEPVRFDGGHKRSRFVVGQLGEFVELVGVCPELELGLGVPRPTLRLVREGDDVHLREPSTGADRTRAMRLFARKRVRALRALDLSGYVLKKDSPSCGLYRVKVYRGDAGASVRDGRGLFAAALVEALPLLPVEEEGRLEDAELRDLFVEKVFAYRRLRDRFEGAFTARDVVAFHTAHKLALMAHSPQAYRELGRLVADLKGLPRAAFRDAYQQGFMAAFSKRASVGRHVNVLQHMAGYFRRDIDADARAELAEVIEDFRRGLAPRLAPLTLIRHHARRLGVDYLLGQVYLHPEPAERMIRFRT